jgi:lysophospholipase L1-like esterase
MPTNLNRAIACTITVASLALSMGFASAAHSPSPNKRVVPVAERAASRAVCTAPAELVRLNYSLNRVAQKILAKQALTIVAIGSSSTFGQGASSPAMSYPSRLAVELQGLFPDSPVTVLNRGVNGETEADMLARFDRDVFAAKPDLVIWQVGSNSVLAGLSMGSTAAMIRDGLSRLKANGVDVIVVDPQYAPAIVKRGADTMVHMIALTTRKARVDLFERFAVMRHWRLKDNMPFRTFVTDDELHMNDWGYDCMAKLLAGAINDVTTRPTVTAAKQTR